LEVVPTDNPEPLVASADVDWRLISFTASITSNGIQGSHMGSGTSAGERGGAKADRHEDGSIFADRHHGAYTPAMTLRNAAFLALVGMILATTVLMTGLIGDVLGVVRGLIPAMGLLTSVIYAFAGLSMVVFLYAFHKAQS
jgi:hypothetical protein